MKKIIPLLFSLFTVGIFAQVIQRNAPWIAETHLKASRQLP